MCRGPICVSGDPPRWRTFIIRERSLLSVDYDRNCEASVEVVQLSFVALMWLAALGCMLMSNHSPIVAPQGTCYVHCVPSIHRLRANGERKALLL